MVEISKELTSFLIAEWRMIEAQISPLQGRTTKDNQALVPPIVIQKTFLTMLTLKGKRMRVDTGREILKMRGPKAHKKERKVEVSWPYQKNDKQ